MYEYQGHVVSVYDADTLIAEIDLGFFIRIDIKIRLQGINAPELRSKDPREKHLARQARDYLKQLVLDRPVIIRTYKQGKYGRYLCDIYLQDGTHINSKLISMGYAREYHGGKREPWFTPTDMP